MTEAEHTSWRITNANMNPDNPNYERLRKDILAALNELRTPLKNVDLFGGTPYLVIEDGDFGDNDTINVDLPVWVLRAIRKAVG